MKIMAASVFEGIVYHSYLLDGHNPCKPTLEVAAILREGDADATSGPLLLPVAEYMVMIDDDTQARACLRELDAKGRVVERMGVRYLTFPTWERSESEDD